MSQSAAILRHLKRGGLLTARSAYRLYGTMRLAARIKELRDRGYGYKPRCCASGQLILPSTGYEAVEDADGADMKAG